MGESGSGKSQTVLANNGVAGTNGQASGQVRFRGQDMLSLPTPELNRIRGNPHRHDLFRIQ